MPLHKAYDWSTMPRTRIKFCGMMRTNDALAAVAAGADAIGMVFYPLAPRCITIEQGREIVVSLPLFVTPVGLFVDQSRQEILEVVQRVGLGCVQLHGHESPEFVAELPGLSILKAIRVTVDSLEAELRRWRDGISTFKLTHLRGIVLESGGAAQPGGTGVENDWDLILRAQQLGWFKELPPVFAAGGLRPDNVGQVIRKMRPFAVDVSSGVESSKGVKSVEKLQQFGQEVRTADAGIAAT